MQGQVVTGVRNYNQVFCQPMSFKLKYIDNKQAVVATRKIERGWPRFDRII